MLYRFADLFAVSYKQTLEYFPNKERIVITGNPIRPEVIMSNREEGLMRFKLSKNKKTLLVFGGSQGARRINKAMIEAYHLFKDRNDLQIIHLTGKIEHGAVTKALEKQMAKEDKVLYRCLPFIDKMGSAYAVTDLALVRAGATTIAEITARGIPVIFVPYPYATGDHQRKNAELILKEGAAKVILDKELNGSKLYNEVNELLGNENLLKVMSKKCLDIGRKDAGKLLAKEVLTQVESLN